MDMTLPKIPDGSPAICIMEWFLTKNVLKRGLRRQKPKMAPPPPIFLILKAGILGYKLPQSKRTEENSLPRIREPDATRNGSSNRAGRLSGTEFPTIRVSAFDWEYDDKEY